jgi:hypothetical protein
MASVTVLRNSFNLQGCLATASRRPSPVDDVVTADVVWWPRRTSSRSGRAPNLFRDHAGAGLLSRLPGVFAPTTVQLGSTGVAPPIALPGWSRITSRRGRVSTPTQLLPWRPAPATWITPDKGSSRCQFEAGAARPARRDREGQGRRRLQGPAGCDRCPARCAHEGAGAVVSPLSGSGGLVRLAS